MHIFNYIFMMILVMNIFNIFNVLAINMLVLVGICLCYDRRLLCYIILGYVCHVIVCVCYHMMNGNDVIFICNLTCNYELIYISDIFLMLINIFTNSSIQCQHQVKPNYIKTSINTITYFLYY